MMYFVHLVCWLKAYHVLRWCVTQRYATILPVALAVGMADYLIKAIDNVIRFFSHCSKNYQLRRWLSLRKWDEAEGLHWNLS